MRSSNYNPAGERGLFRRDRRIFDQRGTFTFTIPDGVTKIWAFCLGAGGGANTYGNANSLPSFGMMGGGKGGGYASGIISGLTPGGTLTCTVASGGIGKYRTTAATAGGNSTVVGGSTTYLQGNGGGAGMSSPVTSDPGNQKGQGGSASTNSVTDAYTAAGGGSGTFMKGLDGGDVSADNQSIITGGGASGSPFGTGMAGGTSLKTRFCPTGGGGWTQRDYPHSGWVVSTDSTFFTSEIGLPGYGSHHPPKFHFNTFYSGRSAINGGRGRTVRGGQSLSSSSFAASGSYNQAGTIYASPMNYWGQDSTGNIDGLHTIADGKDGNPHWWFPWEIDGSGGGGGKVTLISSKIFSAGDGGPGAGGGGMFADAGGGQAVVRGGQGGFGGGGGGAMAELTNISYLNAAIGGNGGNGGGGGGAMGRIQSSKYMPIGGDGGDGAIGLYW